MSTSPCHFEAGECSNSFLGPIPSTSYPDGLEENPKVSSSCSMAPVEMSRSENEGSFSVSQLHVVSPMTVMQTDADRCRLRFACSTMVCLAGRSVRLH